MSKTLDEGVIKFHFELNKTAPLDSEYWKELEKWRLKLFDKKLIGEYPTEKVGYGNLSQRILNTETFTITGTQTGRERILDGSYYTNITECNLLLSKVVASGPIAPSSETLTHFAIYRVSSDIKTIFHIHDQTIWEYMIKNNYDFTSENVSYGTEMMATEAQNCIGSKLDGIFVMKGHQDGVIAYAENCQKAGELILEIYKKSREE